jgi:uncharacterized protein (DUF4213/DUF364 family)
MDRIKKTGITERLKQIVTPLAEDIRVLDVRIGIGYTAVQLDDGRLGLAYTFTESHKGGCDIFCKNRSLAGSKALDLISLVDSCNPIEAAVGVAACNAITNTVNREYLDGDVLSSLDLKKDDQVCMVGNFHPIASLVKSRVAELFIFEQVAEPIADMLPADEIFNYLPSSQVVLLTSTSLINHTAENILKGATGCREVVMLGISTPLIPALYSGLPVTMISGSVVLDTDAVKQVVSEGGGMKAFSRYIQKVNLRIMPDQGDHF